ncbi:hypothetical protein G9A89_010075 [Geosiphon pyriformis]|nr:hypothetical protein G9A89_010075 [Geosiphon pyriformis]
MINLSTRPLGLANIGNVDGKFLKSWSSEIKSKASSVGGLLDLENMKNTVTKETSYADLNASVVNGIENDTIFKKMYTHMYILGQSLKTFSFNVLSNNEDMVALPSSKFNDSNQLPKIIRLSFTLELSLDKTRKMTICEKILVNNDVKKPSSHLNWKIIVKKILVNLFKSAIVAVFFKFGKIVSVKLQLVGLWQKSVLVGKNSVYVTLVISDKMSWISRNMYYALLYTLPVSTTVHDLSKLMASYDKKTSQVAGSFSFHVISFVTSGCSVLSDEKSFSMDSSLSVLVGLSNYLVSLECFLELLADQVFNIMKKLSFIELVLLVTPFQVSSMATSAAVDTGLNLDIRLDDTLLSFIFLLPVVDDLVAGFNSNSSKVLIFKMGGLELKMVALKVSIRSVLNKLNCLYSSLGFAGSSFLFFSISDLVWKFVTCNIRSINISAKQKNVIKNKFEGVRVFTFGLDMGFASAGVIIIMNNFLAYYVAKMKKISGQVIVVCFLFKGKLSVAIIGLYFEQVSMINFIVAKAVNFSTFVVLGGDFNKNALAVVGHSVGSVSAFFNTNHKAVMVPIGLDGLLDICLNSLYKWANKDHWKFKIKDVNSTK